MISNAPCKDKRREGSARADTADCMVSVLSAHTDANINAHERYARIFTFVLQLIDGKIVLYKIHTDKM